jgi:hypothetical protein
VTAAVGADTHPLHVALAVVLGAGFLSIFFEAVRFRWPESYFGAGDTSSYAISLSPLRYLAFRFFPVYAVCVFVAVSLERTGDPASLGALLVGAVHAVTTVGVAFVRDLLLPALARRQRAPIILLRGVIFALTVGVALGASASAPYLEPLIPTLHDVTITLWTAAIAAVGGAYILQISRGRTSDTGDLARRSSRRIPGRLWHIATELARAHGADPQLVGAIMIAENLQRPRWFRVIERLKGLVLRPGTYGIMQVAHGRPISDEESLRIAVATRLSGVRVRDANGNLDYQAMQAFAQSWNPDRNFVQVLWSAYEEAGQRLTRMVR